MVVLVCPTKENKTFPVRANSLGLETDAKLRKVILEHIFFIFNVQMSNPHIGWEKPTSPYLAQWASQTSHITPTYIEILTKKLKGGKARSRGLSKHS